jgi:hypothetical protein
MNLLQETLRLVSPNDVLWVGSSDGEYGMSWEDFAKVASVEYDEGYGGQEVANDLVVVLKGGSWLERREYDGSEGWQLCTKPKARPNAKPFTKLLGSSDLKYLNEPESTQ